jgi:hypothetical protein
MTHEMPPKVACRRPGLPRGEGSGPAAWAPAVLLLAASLAGVGWAGLRPPPPGGPVAAVFPPWWSAELAFAAAARAGAGAVVAAGSVWPTLVLAPSPDPGLPDRLRAGGAWLVTDPAAFGGCSGKATQT